jgi:hypothetical protein
MMEDGRKRGMKEDEGKRGMMEDERNKEMMGDGREREMMEGVYGFPGVPSVGPLGKPDNLLDHDESSSSGLTLLTSLDVWNLGGDEIGNPFHLSNLDGQGVSTVWNSQQGLHYDTICIADETESLEILGFNSTM